MSTTIQSCPGCKSLILADTYECPECGCVLDQKRKNAANERTASELKSATLTEPCPHCREEVRIGLVRCWNCAGFMRDDIARRYQNMTATPQPIIYSDVPPDERTDFMPARAGDDAEEFKPGIFDAEDDGFSLDAETSMRAGSSEPEFELNVGPAGSATAAPAGKPPAEAVPKQEAPAGPDQPKSQTPGETAPAAAADSDTATTDEKPKKTESADKDTPKFDADELLSIALQEQKEVERRRQVRKAEQRAKRMLIPCRCGAWVRVHERHSGRTVRCRQCKQLINIPEIKRKAEKQEATDSAPKLNITWLEEVWFHAMSPTSLVLKPGSLADDRVVADLALTDDSVVLLMPAADTGKKKKGLFGSGGSRKADAEQAAWREAVREHVTAGGEIAGAPNSDIYPISKEHLAELKLVQPIIKAQESMFAGVPVFGEGRVAVYLPVELSEGRQAFCSLPLTTFRRFHEKFRQIGGPKLPTEENGVPQSERHETLACHYSQQKVEAVRDLPYYQQDDSFKLELTGYRCVNCRIVVSEEGRQKNKLGGASGKGLAKAKCPKCGGKFGNEPLYKATAGKAGAETES